MIRLCMLGLLGSIALAGVVHGAQARSARLIRYDRPLGRAQLDLATGTVTREPAVRQRVAGTVVDFPNVDLGGFIGSDTTGGLCQWFDAGIKGINGNASDLMNNFIFAYCSTSLGVEVGGPGGRTTIGFYEGYTAGGNGIGQAPNGTAVTILSVAGLPATTTLTCGKWTNSCNTSCYLINITLPSLVPFADGPIGYSWKFVDVYSGPCPCVPSATVPFLSCVQSCLGPGPDGLGMIDSIDRYCPPGNLLSTFSFGTTQFGSYFTSMSMSIRELGDCSATTTTYNSTSPACVDVLSGPPLVIGTTWVGEVTHAPGMASASTLLVRGAKIPGNGASGGTSGGEPRGRLLVTGAFIANLSGTADTLDPILATERNFVAPIPLQFGLACNEWFAQALTLGAGKQKLSNGLELDTGL